MKVTRTEAIKRFLNLSTHADLAALYHHDMEVQVNVAQDGGDRVKGDFKGRKWLGWTDGLTTWKALRIPYGANTNPEYTDVLMNFDLAAHAEGIGMTGWNWKEKVSKWVAFDFDAIVGHSDKNPNKLSNEELQRVQDEATEIEWVTIRKSTSGNGLHLYVYVDNVKTETHNEHAALGRAILGQMSALVGFDFDSKVDICGGNMWIWHRKMRGTEGLLLLKSGSVLSDIPPNWKEHVKVIRNKRRKHLQHAMGTDPVDDLTSQYPRTALDEKHQELIKYLKDTDAIWWWNQDKHMLVTHTINLKKAHEDLKLEGFYDTNSHGLDMEEQNCFLFPLRDGAWAVRRFSQGCSEHTSWGQDASGWTRCFLNRQPNLSSACTALEGLEHPKGGFVFRDGEAAIAAARLLGVDLKIATALLSRKVTLKEHRDGRLVAEIPHEGDDMADKMIGWLAQKGKWTRIYNTSVATPMEKEVCNYDHLIRHLVTEQDEDYGWVLQREGRFGMEPINHIRIALTSLGVATKEASTILGSSVFRPWKIVNRPFEAEYPGNRQWNRDGAQLRFLPTENGPFNYPNWMKILEHTGRGLDESIKDHPWCRANGILTGADYLKCWIASLFQEPMESVPYLFFFSAEQSTGKSTFHEALEILLTKGYKRADAAMTSQGGFNKELEGALICVIEETDLNQDKQAYGRMKDWVTAPEILIHPKGETPYHTRNSTHWIQCANDYRACPIFPGDTRVTMINVPPIDPLELIPRKHFIPLLEKEAPDFLGDILSIEIPPSNDRLNIPVIETADKDIIQQLNMNPLESFLNEKCRKSYGSMIKFSDFFDTFKAWLDPDDIQKWSIIKVGRHLPPQFPKGRIRKSGQFHIGNITWLNKPIETNDKHKLVVVDTYLENVRG